MRQRLVAMFFGAAGAALVVQACSGDNDTSGSGGSGGSGGATSSTSSTTVTSSTMVSVTSGIGGSELPDTFTVTGTVTDGDAPVEGATVMQAGGSPALTTGPDGTFSI